MTLPERARANCQKYYLSAVVAADVLYHCCVLACETEQISELERMMAVEVPTA